MGYTPFIPGRYDHGPAMHIADLMMQQGRDRAAATARSGEIWGNAISGLGQQVGGAIQQIGEAKAQSKRSQAFEAAVASGDPQKIMAVLGPKDGPPVINALASHAPDGMKKYANRMEILRDNARGILASPPDSRLKGYEWAKQSLLEKGIITPEEAQEPYDEGRLRQMAGWGEAPAKEANPVTVPQGSALVDPRTGQPLYTNPKEAPPPSLQHIETESGIRTFDPRTGALGPVIAKSKPTASETDRTDLSAAGLDMAALNYLKTGNLPALGMGDKTTRKRIIDRAASMSPEEQTALESGGRDLASNRAGYAADSAALKGLQKQTDAVSAFEATATRNAAILEDVLKRTPDAGAKFLNRPLRSLKGQMGSEDMAAFNAIRQSVQNEYARIISNPALSGTMSDSARKEAEALLSPDATVGQIRSALKVLKSEAANRHQSYQEQIGTIQGRIRGGQGGQAAPSGGAQHGPAIASRRLDNGKTQKRDANGVVWEE